MDKNLIKKHLNKRFVTEATEGASSTPGISMYNKINKEDGKINKDGVKDIDKDMSKNDKNLKQIAKGTENMAVNKFNYEDGFEKTYHDEMEIMNGQEMIQYNSKPSKIFKEKAKEGLEGSSRMGNAIGGNAEAAFGASSDDFGKDLTKKIKASQNKRSKETPTLNLRGRDIQADLKDTGHKPYALDETNNNNNNPQIKESMKRLKFKKEFNGVGNALKLIPESYRTDKKEFEMTDGNETYRIRWEGSIAEGRAIVLSASDKKMVTEDISRMKALFNYKSESTLGLLKGSARIDENAAFADVYSKTKKLLGEEEDIESVKPATDDLDDAGITQAPEAKKHIEGSVPTEKKTNAPEPKEGNWEEAKTGVAEGKADKKTNAPKPKVAPFEEAGIKQAAEAKKHVEGSVKTEKKTNAPKPKAGTESGLDDAVKQAPEAKKDIATGKGKALAATATKKEIAKDVVTENEEEETPVAPAVDDDSAEEPEDNFYKADDDDSAEEKEPTATDIKSEPVPPIASDDDDEVKVPPVPSKAGAPKLMHSPSANKYYLMVGTNPVEVPEHFLELARKNPSLALTKMQDEADFAEPNVDDEMDEMYEGKK